jgi:hypothetical protein
MPVRTPDAEWTGTLREGAGTMRFGGGAFEEQHNVGSRFEEGEGTNPLPSVMNSTRAGAARHGHAGESGLRSRCRRSQEGMEMPKKITPEFEGKAVKRAQSAESDVKRATRATRAARATRATRAARAARATRVARATRKAL